MSQWKIELFDPEAKTIKYSYNKINTLTSPSIFNTPDTLKMEPSAADTSTNPSNTEISEEISPVRSKMANLVNRSSFASFFLKNKKNIHSSKIKNDPIAGGAPLKPDPSTNYLDSKAIIENVQKNYFNHHEMTPSDGEIIFDKGKVKEDPFTQTADDTKIKLVDDAKINLVDDAKIQIDDDTKILVDTIISSTTKSKTVRSTRKRSCETIIISDTEPITIIDSDIEIILPRRSQRNKNTKSPPDVECISISSDDGDRNKINDLRRSNRINGITPSTPIIPLSDYSNMRKLDFSRPTLKLTENIIISDIPVKQVKELVQEAVNDSTGVLVKPITVVLKIPNSPDQSQAINDKAPDNIDIARNDSESNTELTSSAGNSATKSLDSSPPVPITNFSSTPTTVNHHASASPSYEFLNKSHVNIPAAVSSIEVPAKITTAPAVPINQIPPKYVTATCKVSDKPSYLHSNRNLTTSASTKSPVKSKFPINYIPQNFYDLDPSLREELMARLSQRENNPTPVDDTKTVETSSTAINSDKFVIFNIIQRLVPGTFDVTKSVTGKLIPSPSFTVISNTANTFGVLKRKLADCLRISPFDLVLTQESGGAGQSELFDTTRPSTLNIVGKTVEEYDRLNVNIRQKSGTAQNNPKTKHQPANLPINVTNINTLVQCQSSAPSGISPVPYATTKVRPAVATLKTHPTSQNPSQPTFPPHLIHRLYLYTKSSFNLYKSLQHTKKQQMYDSLIFLQTADEEMSKLSQDPVNKEDQDLLDNMEMRMSQSQAAANVFTINVKTAASRNQSHPIKISSAATIAQLLQSFTTEYNRTGTKVIFDGDVLRGTETIGNILEDNDMVEIK